MHPEGIHCDLFFCCMNPSKRPDYFRVFFFFLVPYKKKRVEGKVTKRKEEMSDHRQKKKNGIRFCH